MSTYQTTADYLAALDAVDTLAAAWHRADGWDAEAAALDALAADWPQAAHALTARADRLAVMARAGQVCRGADRRLLPCVDGVHADTCPTEQAEARRRWEAEADRLADRAAAMADRGVGSMGWDTLADWLGDDLAAADWLAARPTVAAALVDHLARQAAALPALAAALYEARDNAGREALAAADWNLPAWHAEAAAAAATLAAEAAR